jgi:hypothetical protein
VHHPELGEELPPQARIKYAYGHIIEHLIIELARAAGHEVVGEQDEITVDGILGHRDCVIDGCIVDVKSAASRSFLKFRDKTIAQDDPFGYWINSTGILWDQWMILSSESKIEHTFWLWINLRMWIRC